MTIVLQMTRVLAARPEFPAVAGISLRNYQGPEDIDRWLSVRNQAFARQRVAVRQWGRADFEAEFLQKPWWRPEWMWLAEGHRLLQRTEVVGTVALALRGEKPVVHWLAVLPAWRRRGVARLLMAALETTAWDAGYRQLWLETHSAWTAALGFYRSLGYRPVESEIDPDGRPS